MRLSLLGDGDGRCAELSGTTTDDLSLKEIASLLAGKEASAGEVSRILTKLPTDPQTIRYRQSVTRDLLADAVGLDRLADLIPRIREITILRHSLEETQSPLLRAIWRLGELNLFGQVVVEMREALASMQPTSEAFIALRDRLGEIVGEERFHVLLRRLPEIQHDLQAHRSVTIGINLDDRLRPVEAVLLSINKDRYEPARFIAGFVDAAKGLGEFRASAPFHANPAGPTLHEGKLPLAPLFDDIDHLLGKMTKPLVRELDRYATVNTGFLWDLLREIGFFIGAARFFRRCDAAGVPVTFPEIVDDGTILVEDLHAPLLVGNGAARPGGPSTDATAGDTTVVANDVRFDSPGQIAILTGPNSGGKTTYLRAVGHALILAQSGLPLPARSATITPVSGLFTHFPRRERTGAGPDVGGRFAEEARRIGAILDEVRPHGIVLLNESLSSTGPLEATEIARGVLVALATGRVHGIYATHLHDLARGVDDLNRDGRRVRGAEGPEGAETDPFYTLAAQTDQEEGGRRTFRIVRDRAATSSLAHDLAAKYGIDIDGAVERIRKGTHRSEP